MILSSWGSAWGTWRAGLGVCHMGIDHPKGIIKNIVPIVMAGVLGIYGLIVSVIITQAISSPGGDGYNTYSTFNGYVHVSLLFIDNWSSHGNDDDVQIFGM
jgi:V-type H+-transporting ATPase proteolipid subunit